MSETMIVQMVIGKRLMVHGVLYRRDDRAYKVSDNLGMELLDLTEMDLPVFRQTRLDRLADDTHVIDMVNGKGADTDGSDDIVKTEVGGKVISTKPTSGRTAADIRKELEAVEAQEALDDVKVDRDDSDEDEMAELMDDDEVDATEVIVKPKSGLRIKTKKSKDKAKKLNPSEVAEI